MKKTPSLILILTALLLWGGLSFAGEIELSGTWVGTTEVPDMGTDEVTLVLTQENGLYAGTITDTLGMANEAECTEILFENNTLTFNFSIYNGYEFVEIYCTLTVEEEALTGQWESEDGNMADIRLERKKE